MNIWRLIPSHDDPAGVAKWSRRNGIIAIGWGQMGNLNLLPFQTEAELRQIVAEAHPSYTTNSQVNGGRSLWRFHHDMQVGDLVILSAKGSRKVTMRVIGDYYFVNMGEDPTHYYEHRRKAEVVSIDPDRLWYATNRAAAGEGIYGTLVRCDRKLTVPEVEALTD